MAFVLCATLSFSLCVYLSASVQPVTQFCTDAFSQYARLTDASVIFSSQFKYLKFFTYFYRYNVFLFMILIFTLLSLIYFSLCPSDRAHLNNVMNQIKVKNKQQLNAVTKKIDQQGGSMSAVELKKMGVKK